MAAIATRTAAAGMKLCAESMLREIGNIEQKRGGEAVSRIEVRLSDEERAQMYSKGTVGARWEVVGDDLRRWTRER